MAGHSVISHKAIKTYGDLPPLLLYFSNPLKPNGYFMYHRFKIRKYIYVLTTQFT